MENFLEKHFEELIQQVKIALIDADNDHQLNNIKSSFLGKKSELMNMMKKLGSLSADERPRVGKQLNLTKQKMESLIQQRAHEIEKLKYDRTIQAESIDLTMPGLQPQIGGLHPLTQTQRKIEDIFITLGFDIVEGNEIEDEYHNFDALNTPPNHPARNEMDTFYIKRLQDDSNNRLLLRSQTSTVQVRIMENNQPPIKIISIGRCYRNDKPDRSHSPFFHQVEGLCVNDNTTFADLRDILSYFATMMFGNDIEWRFRPHFFPFTEPSAEFDIRCFSCKGAGCSICKQSGWLEIGGAGMVDPNVFDAVGIDSERFTGYAFGLGIDRITLLKYRLPDIRILFENDVRFLKQLC